MSAGKVERLLSLMNVLMGSIRPISSDELRRRVPGYPSESASFKRAFERDKDELREMGVPLLVEPIAGTDPPGVGYRIRRQDYAMVGPDLTDDELDALSLAAAVLGVGGGMGQRGLFKLGGSATTEPAQELPTDPNLAAAFTGVSERRALRFSYNGLRRDVRPYRLQFARGRWYLNGFDESRGEDRWYRMGRIEGAVEVVGGPGAFARPAGATADLRLAPWEVGDGEAVEAVVRFDPEVAATVRLQVAADAVVADDESGLTVTVRVTNTAGFRSWLLSFLDRAEVLEPAELRDDVIAWLEDLAHG